MSREKCPEEKVLEESPFFFVYGSLKKGKGNHSILGTSPFIQEDATYGFYSLGDIGFPYAVPRASVPKEYHKDLNFAPVFGEVYEVQSISVVKSLDRLEGEGSHYFRKLRMLDSGLMAWVYEQPDWQVLFACKHCHLTEKGYHVWL